jgi:hypothetical protein
MCGEGFSLFIRKERPFEGALFEALYHPEPKNALMRFSYRVLPSKKPDTRTKWALCFRTNFPSIIPGKQSQHKHEHPFPVIT